MTGRAGRAGLGAGALDRRQAHGPPAARAAHAAPADVEAPPHRPARRAVGRDEHERDRRDVPLALAPRAGGRLAHASWRSPRASARSSPKLVAHGGGEDAPRLGEARAVEVAVVAPDHPCRERSAAARRAARARRPPPRSAPSARRAGPASLPGPASMPKSSLVCGGGGLETTTKAAATISRTTVAALAALGCTSRRSHAGGPRVHARRCTLAGAPGAPSRSRTAYAAANTMSSAPSQSTVRPSSRSCSAPSVMVRKWLPASWPILLANSVPP